MLKKLVNRTVPDLVVVAKSQEAFGTVPLLILQFHIQTCGIKELDFIRRGSARRRARTARCAFGAVVPLEGEGVAFPSEAVMLSPGRLAMRRPGDVGEGGAQARGVALVKRNAEGSLHC